MPEDFFQNRCGPVSGSLVSISNSSILQIGVSNFKYALGCYLEVLGDFEIHKSEMIVVLVKRMNSEDLMNY